MESSDLQQQQHHFLHHQPQQHHQKQMNSGLARYQSAPSSYFSNLLDKDFCEEFLNRPSSPETERIFARFLANTSGNLETASNQNLLENKKDSQQAHQQTQMLGSMNNRHCNNDSKLQQQEQQQQQQQQQQRNFSTQSQSFYPNQQKPPLPDQIPGGGMDYRLPQKMKISGGNNNNNTNLVRHSSSPAGLFSNINIQIENGYAVLRAMGADFGGGNRETAYNSLGSMSPIAEMENKNMGENNNPDDGDFGETSGNSFVNNFPIGTWDDSSIMPAGAKRLKEEDRTLSLSGLNAAEIESGEIGKPPPMLAHHLSLPKTSAEFSAIEKFLQFQDSVPCKIRAKRGCATHPRSIAERVRRTKISDRMRKLQDLVPNMDKQTNTSDMLDLAVDYIKDLQGQVKTLAENRAKCTCRNR